MFVSDFTKPPEEVVIDLINYDNGKNFAPGMLFFDAPVKIPKSPPVYRNTQLRITATVLNRLKGSATVYYNRIDLADVPGLRGVHFEVPNDTVKLSDMISLVNARYGVNLTGADYVDGVIANLSDDFTEVDLVAKDASLVFIGKVTLIVRHRSNAIPLPSAVPFQFLDIFRYTPRT